MRWERTCAAALCEELEAQVEGTSKTEYQLLQDAAADISSGRNEEERCTEMFGLMETSHSKMRHASSTDELNELRHFYTDSCILRGLAQSILSLPLQAVATLDLAIIIAGAYGVGRMMLITDAITRIQSDIRQNEDFKMPLPVQAKPYPPYSVRTMIPCLSPPSFISFQSTFSSAPFILRNYAQSWPALTDRPWRLASYLRSVAGPGRVVPVEVGADYRLAEWKQDIISWDVFLSSLDFEDCPRSTTDLNIFYLAQHDLMKQFPSLRDDILVPDYVYASLTAPECPGYQPPLNEGVLFNTWLGPGGTISPAHTDPFYNFYVQVVGYKSVWLAPPSISSSMYPYPPRSTKAGNDPNQHLQGFELGNTSQVDVFSDVNELKDFPSFIRDVVPISRIATLGPGDVLFFPPGWWHAMKSESTSFSLSMWF